MKRRILSMVLCLAMVMTAFAATACGQTDEEAMSSVGEDDADHAMTLTIWGIKGKGTTDEAIALVEEAMSSITEAQFNTSIKLMLYTESEYDKALEAKMDEIQAQLDKEAEEAAAKKAAEKEAKKNDTTDTTTAEETSAEESTEYADETILDEYGLPATLYPEVEDTQLDIFLMTDYEMLMKYSEKGVLSALDEQLSSSSKLLKSYIHPTILSAGKVGKTTYAILNNQPIGEYTYILLNKELMDKYYYDADNIKSLSDAYDFIIDVGTNDKSYTPVMGDLSALNVFYFTEDGSESIIGNMLPADAVAGTNGAPDILPSVSTWKEYIILQKKLEANKWVGAEEIKEGDKFAVGFIKGNAGDIAAYEEDYYINVVQNPQATTENMYNGMFAVSTYTKSLARSMEIITYLNTKSDLRNLFAYGIEGTHYELDDDGLLKMISDDYNMELAYTGNMFVAYPPEGADPEIWEYAKAQNLDMVLSPWYKFTWTEEQVDADLQKAVAALSKTFFAGLKTQTADTIEEYLNKGWDDVLANSQAMEWYGGSETENELTMGKVYSAWFSANYGG
ncbi:MAG: hypothetical protein IJ493_07900 [Clostridia bacterium]|nr:hypothetical protein [Clostridia bacterium]